MKTLMKSIALAAALAWGGAGCIVEAYPPHGAVIIESGHVHSEWCGHYYHRGSWYIVAAHRHGPGCGHIFRGGVWILAN